MEYIVRKSSNKGWSTIDEAKKEAERLCRNQGQDFTLYAAIGTVKVKETPINWFWGLRFVKV